MQHLKSKSKCRQSHINHACVLPLCDATPFTITRPHLSNALSERDRQETNEQICQAISSEERKKKGKSKETDTGFLRRELSKTWAEEGASHV